MKKFIKLVNFLAHIIIGSLVIGFCFVGVAATPDILRNIKMLSLILGIFLLLGIDKVLIPKRAIQVEI